MKNLLPVSLIVSLILLVFAIAECNSHKIDAENWRAKHQYEQQLVDSFHNRSGLQVVEQPVAETNDKEEIKKLSAQVFDLEKSLERKIREVSALVKAVQRFELRDTTIAYSGPPSGPPDSLVKAKHVIIPPRKFDVSTKWYSIHGKVLLEGLQLDSLAVENEISFRVAQKKKGIFGRETIVQAINTNPHMSTTSMQSIIVKNKTSSWNKWIKPALTAAAAIIIKNQLK